MKAPNPKMRWDVLLIDRKTMNIESVMRRKVKLKDAEHSIKIWLPRIRTGLFDMVSAPFQMYCQGNTFEESKVQEAISINEGESTGGRNNWITPHKDRNRPL